MWLNWLGKWSIFQTSHRQAFTSFEYKCRSLQWCVSLYSGNYRLFEGSMQICSKCPRLWEKRPKAWITLLCKSGEVLPNVQPEICLGTTGLDQPWPHRRYTNSPHTSPCTSASACLLSLSFSLSLCLSLCLSLSRYNKLRMLCSHFTDSKEGLCMIKWLNPVTLL